MALKKPTRTAPASHALAAQMDWLNDLPAQSLSSAHTLQWLNHWTGQGLLRHLDSALATQLLRLDAGASPAVLVAAAVLAQMEWRGHTCLPLADVCQPPAALLGWPAPALDGPQGLKALWAHLPSHLADWHSTLLQAAPGGTLRRADAPDLGQPLVLGGCADAPLLYLRRYAGYEQRVGQTLLQRAGQALAVPQAAAREWLDRFFVPHPQAAADIDWQKVACAVALRARLSVITGGPGTGKTYTAARLLALLLALHPQGTPLRVALAAPTGKAAARLKQSINDALVRLPVPADAQLDLPALIARMGPARTLHSLLGARPGTRAFRHHAGHWLDVDVLIVDEASMVHLEMMDALLQALPPTARLVLLGDKDQLASVEAGAVLGELCRDASAGRYSAATAQFVQAVAGQTLPGLELAAGEPPVIAQQTVMLRHSLRFDGPIGQLAVAVNAGWASMARAVLVGGPAMALQPASTDAIGDLAVGQSGLPSYADYLASMQELPSGQDRLADEGGQPDGETAHADGVRRVLKAFERFRILCAVHRGDWGTEALNALVQKVLVKRGLLKVQGEWYAGRPVMVMRNDAQLGVFNGDVGVVLPNRQGQLKAWFLDGESLRSVSVMRLPHVQTAFAMTVHKSQGSEFEHTVLVLPPGGADVLSRELVYTGITRARQQFTLVEAEAHLLEAALARPSLRASGLSQWWR